MFKGIEKILRYPVKVVTNNPRKAVVALGVALWAAWMYKKA